MDNYNTIFGVKWPAPGIFGITLVLGLFFLILIIYLIYRYFEAKEQLRVHNYQHFLFLAKSRGLNNFQFKILKNISSYFKLSNPKELISNPALFESSVADFIEYLKSTTEDPESLRAIFLDLAIIYERLYMTGLHRKPLKSMADIEDGEIMYITPEVGGVFLGKVSGRGSNSLEIMMFSPAKNLKIFETETKVSLHLLRIIDAVYLINTVTQGVNDNMLSVMLTDDFKREREFRHPYIDVELPAVIKPEARPGETDPEPVEGTIVKLNENECIIRIQSPLEYNRDYPVIFEVADCKINAISRLLSSKILETGSVYYLTFRFMDMTDAVKTLLAKYIEENL